MKSNRTLLIINCIFPVIGIVWSIVYLKIQPIYFSCLLAFCALALAVSVFCTVRCGRLTRDDAKENGDNQKKLSILFILPFVLTAIAATLLVIGIYAVSRM